MQIMGNSTKPALCFLLFSASLAAWTVPAMRLDPDLSGVEPMMVDGRQGWQVKQVIAFGEFRSGPVKRGWTRGYNYPFIVRFSAAKEKLSYETADAAGGRIEAFCMGRLSEQDFHKFHEYFEINLRTRDVFSCTLAGAGSASYDFYVEDLNQNRTSGEVSGSVRGAGIHAEIRPVWWLESGKKSWDVRPLGFEFVIDGVVAGAVETVNDGRVWLTADLPEAHRLVLSSVASALLLRSDLADHNDDL